MKLRGIRVEYRKNPIGLSVKKPRFSWKMESDEKDTVQKSYRVIVTKCISNLGSQPEGLEQSPGEIVWDTGMTESDESILLEYEGKELEPECFYRVRIQVEDNHGNTAYAETAFETGILDNHSFRAEMITHNFEKEETACPVFCKAFTLNKKVVSARLYATAYGVYEVCLNGKRVEDYYMAPGWTSYRHRLQYQIYDVTEQLSRENRIEMTVGNGWYKGILGFYCQPDQYGDRTAAFLELRIVYEDGSRESIATDQSWEVRTGEIRYSEIYMGEIVDTDSPETRTGQVSVMDFDKSILTAQENEPVRITEKIPARELLVTPKGEKLVDFGQNLTGFAEIHVHGEKGQKIVVRHAETLDKDGNFYPETLRQAKSVDTYICNGQDQIFHPHFTFHGFRYICVEGMESMEPGQFTACVLHSDMEKTGSFRTSNPKVNQLQSNIEWSQRDNFLDIPTDCPQRDERLGWTGDAQIFSWTAAFNRNTALFFGKWMRDIAADSSREKGVPHVVPDIMETYSSSAWSDAAVIIPWVVYQNYGDQRILEESWQCMHEWVDYIQEHTDENGLWMSGFQYGDWLALDKEESADRTGATDKFMIANAYYIYVTDIVRQTALVLGKEDRAEYYRKLHDDTLASFREEYYTPRGRIVSETQTGCVLSLHFDLAKEKDREKILDALKTNIENHKNHLSTGFVGTPYLCHALSDNGAHDMAAMLFMREDFPSWLYAVDKGATTIWERWNSIMPDGSFEMSGMNSLNHYAYGSIGDWMYRKIGGINQLEPGYHRFYVRPMFVTGIEEARAELDTPYGKIVSEWSCRDQKIRVKVCVPVNTTAVLYLPEKERALELGSGVYEYEYATETSLKKVRFSMDSNLGELVAEPLARVMFEQMAPGFLENPMIEFACSMTLSELLSSAPEARPMYEAVIHALNTQEK